MSAKKYAKRFLYGLGKALYLFGKGIYFVSKAFAKAIGAIYRDYQKRQRIEEERRQYYERIEREGEAYGRGLAQGMTDVREQERARREQERYWKKYPERIERFIYGDESPKKRKKRRQLF